MARAKTSGINWPRLLAAVLTCQAVGNIGTIFTFPALSGWYASLNKPFINPPNWLFGPVWLILYTFLGISLYLIWNNSSFARGPERSRALRTFAIQLALNPVWSFLFFGLRSPIYGFIGIVLLWVAILAVIVESHKVSKPAAIVLLPYLCWVSFAAVLNFSLLLLNAH
jgi:tryptophan-rich sensory protein